MNLTLEEQERAAYMAGDIRTAQLFANMEELENENSRQSDDLEDFDSTRVALDDLRATVRKLAELLKAGRVIRTREAQQELAEELENLADDPSGYRVPQYVERMFGMRE